MLTEIRKRLGGIGATIILTLLIGAFALWGIGDVFKGGAKDSVAAVNGKGISEREFLADFDRALRRANQNPQQEGGPITADEARKRGLDRSLLDEMVSSKALAQAADKLGFTISDAALAKQVREIPAFQDGLKRFDDATYKRMLSEVGYTPKSFETDLRTDLVRSQLGVAVASGARLPTAFLVQELMLRSETRDIRYVKVPGSAIKSPPAPTEAEIKEFYDQQGGQLYAVPEFRGATLVQARPADFAAKANIPEDQIKATLEARKAEFTRPELRSFHQLPAPDAATAQKVAARAKKGEALTAIAASLKLDAPLTFQSQARETIADPKVAEAVFSAKPGEIVGPVTGALGSSVVVVDSVIPGAAMNEAEARKKVRDELALESAKDALFAALETFEDAMSGGDTLEAAAKKAGLSATSFEPINREGLTASGEPIEALVPEKVRAALFATASGEHSESDDLDDGSYFIVRTDKVTPADKRPLEVVKGDVAKRVAAQKRADAIKAAADSMTAAAEKDGFDKAAAARGLKILTRAKLHRGETDAEINQMTSNVVFSVGLKQAVAGPSNDGGFIAAEVTDITREDPRSNPQLIEKIKAATEGRFGGEIANTYQAAVLARSKIEFFQERFDRANGRGAAEDQ